MDPIDRKARIAGAWYLLVVIAGPFVLLYVPGKLFVAGDPVATVENIRAHEALFRAYIGVGLAGQLAFVATALALYRLLQGVSRELSALMVILVLLETPLALMASANRVATLSFVRGGELLAAFDRPQREALAMLLMEVDRQGVLVSEVFWGLWLLPLGLLVVRSGFLPRVLGLWLLVNGIAYLVISGTALLAPEHQKAVFTISTPVLFGEMALMLWLLVFGARVRRSGASALRTD